MKHPILNESGLKIYILVWGVILLAHTCIIYFFLNQPLPIAIADSVIYNILFAILAIGLWYVVTYAGLNKDEFSIGAMHLMAATLTVVSWAVISGELLTLVFEIAGYKEEFILEDIWRGIIGLLYYSIAVLVFYLIKYYHDVQAKVQKESELQTLLKDAELRMLKSQINPHFIFNSLNSISALTITQPDLAQEMVIKLSEFLRYSLGKESAEMNSLEEEINSISLYMDIEKVRFGERLKFINSVSDDCLNIKVPNLILQPIIENAIKYGVYDNLEEVIIELDCTPFDDMIHLNVSNNFDAESVKSSGKGIGLSNVRNRLKLVYDRSNLLETKQIENNFHVILKIPMN